MIANDSPNNSVRERFSVQLSNDSQSDSLRFSDQGKVLLGRLARLQLMKNALTFTVEQEVARFGTERAADEAAAELTGQTAAVKRACGVSTETQHAVINIPEHQSDLKRINVNERHRKHTSRSKHFPNNTSCLKL